MTSRDLDVQKGAVRERVWALLEREGVAPAGVHGHIPAFVGAGAAANRLAALSVWREAEVVKSNPDRAQLPVRVAALDSGKLLYMAVPRLATTKPFYLLDCDGRRGDPVRVREEIRRWAGHVAPGPPDRVMSCRAGR